MPGSDLPSDAPPSYNEATGSSSRTGKDGHTSHLNVPGASSSSSKHGDIPALRRRSMEDEMRPLPEGWVRTFDPETQHQFFVDTRQTPPRSIWTHPYDDEEYLRSLSGEERERIEQESLGRGHPKSKADIMHDHTDEEDDHHDAAASSSHAPQELPPRTGDKGKKPLGRKIKDKLTGTTHEEREKERQRRAEEERKAYETHLKIRQAMVRAAQTGEKQLIGKDRNGDDVYIQPPSRQGGMYGGSGYGYSPYGSYGGGMYARPAMPYGRPYGGGFGGGYGMPLALGMGGGLMGGMLLGDMMGGGMGGFGGGGF